MKKTLLATAILGAMSFAAVAQAAPTVYGNIQLAVDLENNNTAGDNGSTIGFKGEEALDNGLTAIYKAEFHFNAGQRDGTGTNGISGSDQNYLGVKGEFGTVRVGAFDTVANDLVIDAVVAPEAVQDAYSAFASNESQQVQYAGDFGGAEVRASVLLNGKAGSNATPADKDLDNAMEIGVKLPVEGFTVSAAYSTYKAAMGVAVATSMDALTVAGKFETSDTAETVISASVAYDYGMGSVYGLVNSGDLVVAGGNKSASSTSVGATYNLGKAMYVYAEVASGDKLKLTGTALADAKATVIGAALVF